MAEFSSEERWTFVARATVSFIILIVGLFVILKGDSPDATMKWAIGAVSLVVGYWLR